MKNPIARYAILILGTLFLQAAFFSYGVQLFSVVFPFPYVFLILLVPSRVTSIQLMLGCFVLGWIVGLIDDAPGIHASACVTMGFARDLLMRTIRPQGGYEPNSEIHLSTYSQSWYVTYSFACVFIHHFFFKWVELGALSYFFRAIWMGLTGALFTMVLIMFIELVVFSKSRRR